MFFYLSGLCFNWLYNEYKTNKEIKAPLDQEQ